MYKSTNVLSSSELITQIINHSNEFSLNFFLCDNGQEEDQKKWVLSRVWESNKKPVNPDATFMVVAGLEENAWLKTLDADFSYIKNSINYPVVVVLCQDDYSKIIKNNLNIASCCSLFI